MCEKYDDIKEKLLLPVILKEKIDDDEDELAMIKSCMERMTYVLSLTVTSSSNKDSTMEKYINRYNEISERLDKEQEEYAMAIVWRNQAIASVKRKDDRDLLKYYYKDGKTVGEINELMGYTCPRSFYRSLARALSQIIV